MQKIVFNDLEAQYAHLKKEIDAGIASVIEGCHFISGPQVEELEKALCAYTGRKYCVTVSSGTDALLMPLMAWGIHEGDAVFVQALLRTGFVPREHTVIRRRQPADRDRWTYIRTQADADALTERFAGFRDATLERLFYKESTGVRQLTVRFDNQRVFRRFDIFGRLFIVGELTVISGGYAVFGHKMLGKRLRTFYYGGVCPGAESTESALFQIVHQTRG